MSYRKRNIVGLSERKFSVESLTRLYEEERIHFPQLSKERTGISDKEIVSELLEAIQDGIPMPVIYVSELQNGDFLILESKDRLRYLLQYVKGEFAVSIETELLERDSVYFCELDERNPRLAADILRTVFILQIIDYQTPKYRHMEVGLFHEKWSVEREQAIRNELYKGQEIEDLKHTSEKSADIMYGCERFSYTLRNEYMTLYMMLFWGVYNDILRVDNAMNEQELLDITISGIDKNVEAWKDLLGVIEIGSRAKIRTINRLSAYYMHLRDVKCKAKILGSLVCYYDMLRIRTENIDDMVEGIVKNRNYIQQIKTTKITVNNIHLLLNFGREFIR